MTVKLPPVPDAPNWITAGVTRTVGAKAEITAMLPAPPAAVDRAKVPFTEDPPTTEAGANVTTFSAPPAAAFSVTAAEIVSDGIDVLAAVTMTTASEATVDGAVYLPVVEMVPMAGPMDQVTPESVAPVTVAVKASDWPADRVPEPGAIAIAGAAGVMTVKGAVGTDWLFPWSKAATVYW